MDSTLEPLAELSVEDWRQALALAVEEAHSGADAGLGQLLSRTIGSPESLRFALSSFVLDGVARATTTEQLCSGLEELAFPQSHVAAFEEFVNGQRRKLETVLRDVGLSFTKVVDISWRLDYVLRSSSAGGVDEPFFLVALRTQNPSGAFESLDFVCNLEQMQDLYAKVQDAVVQVRRLLQSDEGAA